MDLLQEKAHATTFVDLQKPFSVPSDKFAMSLIISIQQFRRAKFD